MSILGFLFGGGARKQHCVIYTEDGRIVEEDLDVLKGFAVNHQKMEAYILDSDNQIKDRKTNVVTQVLAERSSAPITIRGIENKKMNEDTIKTIAIETRNNSVMVADKKNNRDSFYNKVLILVSIPCITVLAVVAFNLWKKQHGG